MNRIEQRLAYLQAKKEKAFITYMTAGLPTMEQTKEIIKAQDRAGIDIIELGIPFSDPAADGVVIQNASYQSIQKGTTIYSIFEMVEQLRIECNVPIIFMMYYNTILHYGVQAFAQRCARAGVDGLIVPDLPLEEQNELREALEQNEKAPILIQLVSPVSKQRLPNILKEAKGFVYCVSSMGVTGQEGQFHKNIAAYLKEVKQLSPIPIMMGFGIKTASDVMSVRDIIDGAIVGSHFITLMEQCNYNLETIQEYIITFKKELNLLEK